MSLKLAHSPDADDAFMFYGLAKGFVPSEEIEFTHILSDIETLNQKAKEGIYEVTALSVHAYPYVSDRYNILKSGASIGDNYGPLLVAREKMSIEDLKWKIIAVPGTLTTAYLALKLFDRNIRTKIIPFNQIIAAVEKKEVDVGLIIHEGQLTFSKNGLHKILDLGVWWNETTGLPLPLGVNGIRKDLEPSLQKKIARLIKESICYSLSHRKEAVEYALQFARGMDPVLADKFIGMYVNDDTIEMSEQSQKAIDVLLTRAFEEGLILQKKLEYI
ncbi:MAG: ABC transporter substrate-binding protein [Chlamydiae bacterium]|nr:ABC transporter substrate-binding protein [Chlamydiota bacterium]MBI3276462.1 ABC transporter substrate-binding protein [Chlamydiota bacterium]